MSRHNPLNCLLVGLLVAPLGLPALAQSVPFPTYQVGANQNGSQGPNYPSTLPNPWVVGSGQIITPAGTQVYLGITTRAKAVALNPNSSTHTAAVLQMGAPQAVTVFNTQTGAVVQTYKPFGNKTAPAIWPTSPASRTALQGLRAVLKSPAARPFRLCQMAHPPRIRPASLSRRMGRRLTWCWTITIR